LKILAGSFRVQSGNTRATWTTVAVRARAAGERLRQSALFQIINDYLVQEIRAGTNCRNAATSILNSTSKADSLLVMFPEFRMGNRSRKNADARFVFTSPSAVRIEIDVLKCVVKVTTLCHYVTVN
jgi:hypothetical protein